MKHHASFLYPTIHPHIIVRFAVVNCFDYFSQFSNCNISGACIIDSVKPSSELHPVEKSGSAPATKKNYKCMSKYIQLLSINYRTTWPDRFKRSCQSLFCISSSKDNRMYMDKSLGTNSHLTRAKQSVRREFIYTCSAPPPPPPTMLDKCTCYFSRVSTLYGGKGGGGRGKQRNLRRKTVLL